MILPHGWKLELKGLDPAAAWEVLLSTATSAEALGYDHVWSFDHLHPYPTAEPTPLFEQWTLMAALSQATTRVRLGQMVSCVSFRHPGLLAKQAACVDVMSNGRLILGVGAGWYQEEYEAYGYPYRTPRDRLGLLEESVVAIRKLWTLDETTFEGKHVHLRGAVCSPKPVQDLPPILIGGEGEKVTLRIAARHADATNWQVGVDAFRHKSAVLASHCEREKTDFDRIARTHAPNCQIFDSAREYGQWLRSRGRDWRAVEQEEAGRGNLVGPPELVQERLEAFVDAGCRDFAVFFRDYPRTASLERLIGEIIPKVTAAAPKPGSAVGLPGPGS